MYLLVALMSRGTPEGGVAGTCPCLQRFEEEEGHGEGRDGGGRREEDAAQSALPSRGNSEVGECKVHKFEAGKLCMYMYTAVVQYPT